MSMLDREIDSRAEEINDFLERGRGYPPAELFVDRKRPLSPALVSLARNYNLFEYGWREIDERSGNRRRRFLK